MVVRLGTVVPGYYLVCYNPIASAHNNGLAVVPGYYLVCYNVSYQVKTLL